MPVTLCINLYKLLLVVDSLSDKTTPMEGSSLQNITLCGLGVVLLILASISLFAYGSLIGVGLAATVSNPILIVAIANTVSLVLLAGLYSQLHLLLAHTQRTNEELLVEIGECRREEAQKTELIQALQESEERFRVALKNSPIVVSNQDTDLRYTWVYNPASGVEGSTLVGQLDTELFDPENAQRIIPIKQRVLTTGVGERQEIVITVDGKLRYYDLTVEPLWNQAGEIVGITCAAANITNIHIREQTLHAIFEETIDAILIADDEGYYVEVNPSASQLFGMPNSQLIGHRIADFMEPGFNFEQVWRSFVEMGQSMGEIRLYLPDGTVRDVEYTAKANFIPGRHLSVLRDITERKKTQQELQYREALLSNILNTLPVGVWITDEQGVILQGNPAGQEIWGGAEYVGIEQYEEYKGWWADTGKRIESHEWALARAITKGETSINELINIECFDGTYKTILNSAMPLRNERQEIIGGMVVNQDITELKQVEEALRQSQHFIQQIADTTPNLLYIYDQIKECNIYANRRTEEFFCLRQAQIQAKGKQFILDVLHPEDLPIFATMKEHYATAKDGEVIESEIRFKNAQGEWRWLHLWEVVFRRNAEGLAEQILGTAIDITERKQLEAELAASEERFRTSIENMLDCFSIYSAIRDEAGQIVDFSFEYVNAAACQNNNLTKEEQLEQGLCELLPAYREAGLFDDYCQVVERGQPLVKESFIYEDNSHGKPFRRAFDIRAVKLGDGLAIAWRDITKRKQAEEALLEERNFISAILDTANALIVVCDRQGKIVRFNRACEQLTGYSFDQVKGQYVWDLFLITEEIKSVKTILEQLGESQLRNEYENYWVAADGSQRLISWSNTVLLDHDSSVKYIIGIGIDITERKRAEEMRRQLEREQELSQLRLRFFSLASHEFRTPLSTVLASAQLLQFAAHDWPEEKRLRNLRRIEVAAKRIRQLLDDILTINRAETGRLEFNPTLLKVEQFCQKLVEEISINTDNQTTLIFVSQCQTQTASLDAHLLRSILINLLNNAIKYSPPGSNVQFTLTCTTEETTFQIQDWGIGIPPSDLPHIFEAFHRGENIGNVPGSGLGLTVAKNCLDLHGGSINVTSRIEVGTTFTVTIPQEKF